MLKNKNMPADLDTHNIRLTVAYDGTDYLGWQATKMGPSIEATLQGVLEKILQQPIYLQAASRTDAGVHAYGQIVNFLTTKEIADFNKFQISINSLLPKDISILKAEKAELKFHPTLDSVCKEYHYWICYGHAQFPQHRLYSWHYPHVLDVEMMCKASLLLIGQHDFAAFCNQKKNEAYAHHRREVTKLTIEEHLEKRLLIKITGPNFLYKMVRNIVGTLSYIGRGKIGIDELPSIITECNRAKAGMTAPAHGLTLYKIYYEILLP
jgi:tRNA pseudouridine38-40 synthase